MPKLTKDHLAKLKAGRKKASKREPSTHTIRTASGEDITIEHYTRSFAIKAFCTECMGFESNVKECCSTKCPLFPFRANTRKTKGN